jgi:aminoglycoside phosphotransferase (APT) family kinase protein
MVNDPFGPLPPAERARAHRALREVIGATPIDAVRPVGGGASGAFVFRVEVGGRRYLVRVEGPASPLRNPHQYVSMRIAAEAGIAPRVHYIDAVGRVAVTDFIQTQPLATFPGGAVELVRAVGGLLGRLQATPVFPRFVDYPDIVARLFAHVRRTGLFAPGVLDPHWERLEQLREALAARAVGLVSSHNDPIPSNILFDGERLWLIDWESAYSTDPLVDVAITLDTLAASPGLAAALLLAWLGHEPDEAVRVRLELVRALTRLYYAGVMFSSSAAALGAIGDTDIVAPSSEALGRMIRAGQLRPGVPETRHVLGKMFLAAYFTGCAAPGFDYAIAASGSPRL